MNRNNNIPETGWTCIAVHDLKDQMGACDQRQYLKCEKCNNEKVRFVHIMRHPEYPRDLCVGRVCAERMSCDSVGPKKKENDLQRKAKRRKAFCDGYWSFNYDKQTHSRKYKGKYITLKKCVNDSWCVVFQNNFYFDHNGRRMKSFNEAQYAAFDIYEETLGIR